MSSSPTSTSAEHPLGRNLLRSSSARPRSSPSSSPSPPGSVLHHQVNARRTAGATATPPRIGLEVVEDARHQPVGPVVRTDEHEQTHEVGDARARPAMRRWPRRCIRQDAPPHRRCVPTLRRLRRPCRHSETRLPCPRCGHAPADRTRPAGTDPRATKGAQHVVAVAEPSVQEQHRRTASLILDPRWKLIDRDVHAHRSLQSPRTAPSVAIMAASLRFRHVDEASRPSPSRTGPSVSYTEQGDPSGAALVLLPGPTDSWRSYQPALDHLPLSIRTIAVSQRGHGHSASPQPATTSRTSPTTRWRFSMRSSVERAILAGHSGSCLVARRVAIDSPDRVAGLVLEASPTTLHGRRPARGVRRIGRLGASRTRSAPTLHVRSWSTRRRTTSHPRYSISWSANF